MDKKIKLLKYQVIRKISHLTERTNKIPGPCYHLFVNLHLLHKHSVVPQNSCQMNHFSFPGADPTDEHPDHEIGGR